MKPKARVTLPIGRIAVVIVLLAVTLGAPSSSSAAQTHVFAGAEEEFFNDPRGIAVDDSGSLTNGHVWLTNGGTVEAPGFAFIYEPEIGNGVSLSPGVSFVSPDGVAVDSAGNGYVSDSGSQRLYKFAPDGSLLWEVGPESLPQTAGEFSALGVTINPANQNVIVLVFNNFATQGSPLRLQELDGAGNFVREIGLPFQFEEGAVAAAGTNAIFNAGGFGGPEELSGFTPVREINSAGQITKVIDNSRPQPTGLAYNATTNQLIVDHGTYVSVFNATTGQQVDKFGSGVLVEGTGIAVVGSSNKIYVMDRNGGSGRYDIFNPAVLPNLSPGGITGLGATVATLHGEVDPAGGGEVTSCAFEYGETKAYGSQASCDPSTPYASATEVAAELTGLLPATEYHYRLAATNASGTGHEEEDHIFITEPGAPQIVSEEVGDLGGDNARINSMINVMGADTTVKVEYGTSTAYGASAPLAGKFDGATGPADKSVRLVSIQLLGLATGTTYHYRVVASNSAGTTVGTDHTLQTSGVAENSLPDHRGYELVTPVNKHGHDLVHEYGIATDNGEAVLYPAVIQVGDTANGYQAFGVARRVNGDWMSDSPYLRASVISLGNYVSMLWPSDDLSKVAFVGGNYTPDFFGSGVYLSNRTGTVRASAGTLQPPVGNGRSYEFVNAGGSPDLSTTYFSYAGALLDQDADRIPTLATKPAGGFYEFKDGQLLPADVLPDGTVDPEGAVPAGVSNTASDENAKQNTYHHPAQFLNQVSVDGTRAFFVSPDPRSDSPRPVELYVHRDGEPSLLASRSDLTSEPAGTGVMPMTGAIFGNYGPTSYASASPDGSHVFFESKDRLTSSAPSDSSVKGYLFDSETQQIDYVRGVTGTVMDVSNDGSRLFFVAGEELAIWEAGAGVSTIARGSAEFQTVSATPDGSAAVFEPVSGLAGFNNGGLPQVYRYETSSRQVECLSCPSGGVAATTPAYLAGDHLNESGNGLTGDLKAPHYYADGGKRVFFETGQQLAVTDTNGASDVYEWEGGAVHLISDGRSPGGSFLIDNSVSGDDVFFATAEQLVPRDRDGGLDVYDASVGADENVAKEAAACGRSCQGEPSGRPAPKGIGSSELRSGGEASPARPKFLVRRGSLHGSSVVLVMNAPSRGRVVVTGGGVERANKTFPRAGIYRLAVALDAQAKKKLKRNGAITTKVRVVFTPLHGKSLVSSVSITVKA